MKKLIVLLVVVFVVYSCDDILEVEDISSYTVTPLAPANGAILTNASVVFAWDSLEDSEHYRLQIATPSFETANQIVLDSLVASTSFAMSLNPNEYEWRLRAENSGYATAYSTQNFTVDTSEPVDISNEQVNLLAPSNNVVFSSTDVINFSWETVSNAENYTVQIATPNFGNAIEITQNETTSNINFSASSLAIGDYEWRVKASNATYETDYTTQTFSVEE